MNSVSDCFTALRSRQECALIPFLTAGDPDLETTVAALKALDSNGADLIELGVPYSDPLADGPVIQAAATRALQRGITLDQVLGIVRQVSPEIKAPIILFTYYNPILNRGVEQFLQDIADAGAAGLVVPDMPLEEIEGLLTAAAKVGIEVILLVAPTSPQERIQAIANQAQGFIYLVSVTGVTGMRGSIETRVQDLIIGLKQMTDKPIGVGFGVSSTEQARQLRAWGADGVIVGSAFVKRLYESAVADRLAIVGEFCRDMKAALK